MPASSSVSHANGRHLRAIGRASALMIAMVFVAAGCSDGDRSAESEASPSSGMTSTAPSGTGASASDASPSAAVDCPQGIALPEGVDRRACGPVPAGAAQFAQDATGDEWKHYGSFVLPSMNIGCDLTYSADVPGNAVTCTIHDFDFAEPKASKECLDEGIAWAGMDMNLDTKASVGNCRGDVLAVDVPLYNDGVNDDGTRARVLGYGDVLRQGDLACLSAKDGVTCWNGKTGHGFKLSRAAQLTW